MDSKITEELQDTAPGLSRAVELLVQGQTVAFPTETVYGLGADARNDMAVARIFAAKDRPRFNPLIVHVANVQAAQKLVTFNSAATRLATAFWPGSLTLVLPLKPQSDISHLVSAGLATLAVRVPAHPLAEKLLLAFGGPVAAPSANLSGSISPTRARHVMAGLNTRIAAVLNGGSCPVGLESTIIGFDPAPMLLRPGGLPSEVIESCIGDALLAAPRLETPNAPGQLGSHYAPKTALRLNATDRKAGEVLLGFGPSEFAAMDSDLNLSASGDLTEAAANLFRHLHELDARGAATIAVCPIPAHGLGRAINDRLMRAAAPRP